MSIGMICIYGLIAAVAVLLILVIIAYVQIFSFKKKYNKFMQGKNAANLEKDIISLYEDNRLMKVEMGKCKTDITDLYSKHKTTFQKLGIVKYDAFKEMGGKLSFAVALLDEDNNGFILNSVHSREGCYSYTKRVKGGNSDIDLSAEEKEAVERAIKSKVKEEE